MKPIEEMTLLELKEYAHSRGMQEMYGDDRDRFLKVVFEKDSILHQLESLNRDQLNHYATSEGIKLFTTDVNRMRIAIMEAKYRRDHHGEAFRY